MSTENTKKDERIDVRVSAEFKALFSRAAALSGMSMSAFVLEAARTQAIKLIDQHERVILNDQARDLFLDMLARPPAPNKALQAAANKHSPQ
jgi:uncharacterized protein (DUF1778 family)